MAARRSLRTMSEVATTTTANRKYRGYTSWNRKSPSDLTRLNGTRQIVFEREDYPRSRSLKNWTSRSLDRMDLATPRLQASGPLLRRSIRKSCVTKIQTRGNIKACAQLFAEAAIKFAGSAQPGGISPRLCLFRSMALRGGSTTESRKSRRTLHRFGESAARIF